ncbi:MAG TPA: transketolase C-terminal domain-containing protein, partial [Terriglobales bacterium]|nr:transketolase C-terminal domain-containing protein [Terriglobales bacterium]
SIKEELPEGEITVDLDKCAVRREGADLTAVSYGYTMQLTMQAAEKMQEQHGISVECIDLRTLNPIDYETILNSIAKTNRLVVIQEDHRTLGIGSEIAANVAEQAFDCLDAPILRVTAPDVPAIPFSAPLEKYYMPSVEKIMTAMERVAQY